MNEETIEMDLSNWFPTYGSLTSQRILERYNIHLDNEELIAAIQNPRSLYYQLLRVPLKNVFNGIILQQAHDYQVYAQKIFIDYLLSGESGKEASSPGGGTREDLEEIRLQLITMGEEFNTHELAHQTLIAESQASLIKLAKELQNALQGVSKKINVVLNNQKFAKEDNVVQRAIRISMINFDKIDNDLLAVTSPFWERMAKTLDINLTMEVRQQLANIIRVLGDPRDEIENLLTPYIERTEQIGINLRRYRTQFYSLILSATDLIKFLPDYRPDKEKEIENRSS